MTVKCTNNIHSLFLASLLLKTNLQHCLDLGRDVSLLVKLDVLLLGPARALRGDLLHVCQHHAVSLGHCFELLKQELQQFQQQPAEGDRADREEGGRKRRENVRTAKGERGEERESTGTWMEDGGEEG